VPGVVEGALAVDDLLHDGEGEGAYFGGGAGAGERAGDANVDVEIGDCGGGEPGEILFDPFRGPD
jgi:hypothetical protein